MEVLVVTPEGLRPVKQFAINGRVQVMKFFRPQGSAGQSSSASSPPAVKDRLFLVTARHSAMILEAEGSDQNLEIVTKAHGDVAEPTGKKSESGTRAIIDPESRAIALRIYDALLKIIPLVKDQNELKAFNIRLERSGHLKLAFASTRSHFDVTSLT